MSIPLLTVLVPLAFVIGIGASAIGATAWMILVPILFVLFGLDLYQTVFISLLVDCGNALIMTIIAARNRQLDTRRGLKLSVFASIVVCMGVYLGTSFIPNNQELFKNPAAFFILLFGLGFIRRGYKQGKEEAAKVSGVTPGKSSNAVSNGYSQFTSALLIYAAVFLVSLQTGLMGTGGGMLYSISLMFCYALPTLKATGTAMLMTLITTVVAALGIFFQIPVESSLDLQKIILILIIVIFSMIGTILGARIAYSVSLKKLNYMIAGVIITAALIGIAQSLVVG